MSSSSVTIDLLDSMLGRSSQQQQNQNQNAIAEQVYRSIPLPDRVRQLSSLLAQLHGNSTTTANANSNSGSNDAGRSMLAAVLLRRDISSLATSANSVSLMGEIAEPLLSLFCHEDATSTAAGKSSSSSSSTRRQIGHCIAELCGSLSLASPEDGRGWMKTLLGRLEPGCAANDITYLRLLTDIAERSPVTLWSSMDNNATDAFASLLRGCSQSTAASSLSLEQLEAALGALVQIGIAYERAKRVSVSSSTSAKQGGGVANEVERALRSQLPESCTNVEANSPPARLGKMFLPGMLEALVGHAAQQSTSLANNKVDVLSDCTSHLSTCADQCPSLVAGEDASLLALMQASMSMAQLANPGKEEDVTFLRLTALDVLATITAVPAVKRAMAKSGSSPSPRCVGGMNNEQQTSSSPMLQFLIHGHGGNGAGDQKGVLYLCAELAVTGVDDDEEGWANDPASVYDVESSWEEDGTALHAESLLESFVENLGGAATLPAVFQLVDVLLSGQSSWMNQRAVLSILERCLAAAPVTFVPHVPATVDAALRLIQSNSARVQHQALQLLGALCCANSVGEEEDQKKKILVRETYGPSILEVVAHLIRSHCTKVASHACLTVVSYCRGGNGSANCNVPIEKNLIVPYVGSLLESLRAGPLAVDLSNPSTMDDGSLAVLIRAIGAVACLADASGEDFLPHYSVMGGLISCALFGLNKSANSIALAPGVKITHETSMLRGAAIEAASIIGQSISGPEGENVETYANDASEIMTVATMVLNSMNTDVIPMDQLLAACARIAAVMGEKFVSFMSSVLPHILNRAAEKLEVSITDANDASNDEEDGYAVSIPGMGSKRVKINTTQLEEKAQSARALYEMARALGAHFGPFVQASADVFLPLVKCEYSGDVRATSAQALSQVFKSACLSDVDGNTGTAQTLLPVLARALTEQLTKESDEEEDIENRFAIADALSEIMWDAYEHKSASSGRRVAQISVADAREIVRSLMSLMRDVMARRSTLMSEMADYSFDNDELCRVEEKAQAEAEYLTHLVDSVGYQLKMLGEAFAPIFEESVATPLGPVLAMSFGNRGYDARAKLAAVCLFDDCVEHCGSAAAIVYAPALLQGIMEALGHHGIDADAELQQAACYGISQVARHAPSALSATLAQDLLMKVYNIAKEVETVSKEDMEHVYLVENSVSAMASLALLRGSPLFDSVSDKSALMKVFMCGLPLEQDFDEAKICHDGLCDLVESNLVNVQTEYGTLIRIIGKILALVSEGEEIASQSTCSRLIGVIAKIQQTVDGNMSTMEPDVQQALVAAMQ